MINMIVGFRPLDPMKARIVSEVFENESCKWVVTCAPGRFGKRPTDYDVVCFLKKAGQKSQLVYHLLEKEKASCGAEQVQRLYECLPTFVSGMLKVFPDLEQRWKPFIDASSVVLYSNRHLETA